MKSRQNNYAFIDSQNLNLSIKDCGWTLNFEKFFIYLKYKYKVTKAFIFIGYIKENRALYHYLQQTGYTIIFKPTLEFKEGGEIRTKGNIDAELVLHCMLEYNNFDKAVIVSGDGDFHCLIEQLKKDDKLLKIGIPNKYSYSALLREFNDYHFYVSKLRHKLEYKKRKASE